MSTPIATATTLTQRSIMEGTIRQLRHAHKAPRNVRIAALLAAALTANLADAETWSRHRNHRASNPENSWTARYAPAFQSRFDRGVSAPSPDSPFSGRGAFEEHNSAP